MNITEIIDKNKQLQQENNELKEKLKKYTAPSRRKKYYETHKEELILKNKEYREKTDYVYEVSPEKKKQYARTAYLNKKEKLMKENEKETNEKSIE
jgi:hypothetical protein